MVKARDGDATATWLRSGEGRLRGRRRDLHVSYDDRFRVVRDPALAPSRDGREETQSLVAIYASFSLSVIPLTSPQLSSCKNENLHNGGKIWHIAVVLRVERVLPRGVELVDLGLQPLVHVRVREQAVGDARKRDRGRVCPCDDRKDPVVDEVLHGRWRLVGQVFVVLQGAQRMSGETETDG